MSQIVIIDDRDTNRTIYSKLALSIGEGVNVQAFADPGEALRWLKRNRPDLIVTDYDMPKIDGDEFITRFRALPHASGVPIIMITVCAQRQLRLRALESGATDFLNPPIDHDEFLMRARNLLSLRHSAESREDGETPRELSPEARRFLARCGEAGDYVLHVVAMEKREGRKFDPSSLAVALRRRLRDGDILARIDRLHFAIVQKIVVDPADSAAYADRLKALRRQDFGVRIAGFGSASPRSGIAPESRAENCLREAMALAARGDGGDWTFLPRIELGSGALAGAQLLRDGEPAKADDAEAWRAARACIQTLGRGRALPRVGLRVAPAKDGAEALAARLASFMKAHGIPPASLDLQLRARDLLAAPERAQDCARVLKSLGAGVTLDLGALAPASSPSDEWVALTAVLGNWREAIKFTCHRRYDEARVAAVARLAQSAFRKSEGRAPLLLADGVASVSVLPLMRRAGVSQAQGPCFGAAFRLADFDNAAAGSSAQAARDAAAQA